MSQPELPPPSQAESPAQEPSEKPSGLIARWQAIPLYLRILGGVILGVIVGLVLGQHAKPLEIPSKLVLRMLGALASPLILLAVVQALMHAKIPRGAGFRLFSLLLLNTLVAILIGLFVANIVRPGEWVNVPPPKVEKKEEEKKEGDKKEQKEDALTSFLNNVPKSLVGPLSDQGSVLSVIVLAVAFGIALRRFKDEKVGTVAELVSVGFRTLIVLLHWIIEVIPLAVFGIVASIIGVQGFGPILNLGAFVVAVLLALALHLTYYLLRIKFFSWVRPLDVLRGMRDALVMAFSTASSTATMPVTYSCLREKVGLRERSASLGALVGANFNNDGTALYEAMAALFISQMLVQQNLAEPLTLTQQFLVVLTSIAASVGAAGIPEAGIVTMTLVFNAVGLPITYIPILLAVDWFLDRCRTTVNVMGDVNVSCLLDGRTREEQPPTEQDRSLAEIA